MADVTRDLGKFVVSKVESAQTSEFKELGRNVAEVVAADVQVFKAVVEKAKVLRNRVYIQVVVATGEPVKRHQKGIGVLN